MVLAEVFKDFTVLAGRLNASARRFGVDLRVLAVLFLALFLRLYCVSHELQVLEGDETEYARLAENLVKARTYVGTMEGPQLMYPPFFPALVAAGAFVAGSYETGGRLVTVLAGLALVLAVFGLVRETYGSRVGLLAATLVACHPVLVALSGAVYSESVYLPLVVGGTYFGLRGLESRNPVSVALCGTLFGLAYLTRPEALFYPFVIVAAALLTYRARGLSGKKAVVTALLVMAPFVVLASPYIAWLSVHAGGLRFEGKSVMNYTIALRRNAGMSRAEATLGISRDLREEGPWLSPNLFVLHAPYPVPLGAVIPFWIASAHRNKEELFYHFVRSPTFGSVVGIGLVALALFRRPWSQRRVIREGVLGAIVLGYLFILVGQHQVSFRYLTPLVPFLLSWQAKGVDEISRWVSATFRRVSASRLKMAGVLGAGVRYALGLLLVFLAVRGGTSEIFRVESVRELDLKDAGSWLAQHRLGPKRIMGYEHVVAYYAGGTRLVFPVTQSSKLALEYVHAKEPDFLVLTRDGEPEAPYYHDWFKHGVPDPAARLVYRAGRAEGREVTIYEWRERSQERAGLSEVSR